MIDYSDLATRLLQGYSSKCIEQAKKVCQRTPQGDLERTLIALGWVLEGEDVDGDDVMEAVDLGIIFGKAEALAKNDVGQSGTGEIPIESDNAVKTAETSIHDLKLSSDREDNETSSVQLNSNISETSTLTPIPKKATQDNLKPDGYDDRVVAAILWYFKTIFFKWVNRPECDVCGPGAVDPIRVEPFPQGVANPDRCSQIEHYNCHKCKKSLQFRRLNNPKSLLRTREGRCGEWVNCFLYIVQALMPEVQFRYIWNYEDHVWCEYFSSHCQRWIHIDPCENVIDEPSLYSNNWNKKMSLVVGFGNDYCIDLLEKYITSNRLPVSPRNQQAVASAIKYVNSKKILTSGVNWHTVYDRYLLPYNKEVVSLKAVTPTQTSTAEKGRQSGKGQWTETRGEDGN